VTATKKATPTVKAVSINAATPLRKSGVIEDLRRVLLVSGSSWLNGKKSNGNGDAAEAVSPAAPPEPPSCPPPRPSELLSLLMVGPDVAGKKALMEQFVHDKKNTQDSACSSPQKPSEGWSVEYRKKDYAYHRSSYVSGSSSSVQCVRLQLWNTTVNSSNSSSNTTTTLPPDATLAWPAALKTHCQHMILVVSMADGKSLADLQKTVRAWKRYLDRAMGRNSNTSTGTSNGNKSTMQLILTLPTASSMQQHAAYHLRVGAAMQRLCTELSILAPSWAVLDTDTHKQQQQHNNESSSSVVSEIHATWMNITEQVLSAKQRQQRQGSVPAAITATATDAANGNDQQYIVATAAAVSTPAASRGNKKTGGSLDDGSSPGTIVVDAQDVMTISPDKVEHLTR
jgi:hypothetical protein